MSHNKSYQLLTVDVWDTLLRRRCHPDSIKLHVARYLLLHYGPQLHHEARDTWALLRLRQLAEKELGDHSRSQGMDDEYGHIAVYTRWLQLAGLEQPAPGSKEHQDLLHTLEHIELEQERYVTYPDPHIHTTLQGIAAQQKLFLSDFYMPAGAIRQLLKHHKLDQWIGDGVVSCDIGVNKRSGRLFSHLHAELSVTPQQHLHIGDNPHADVSAPGKLGISSIHYLPEAEHSQRLKREQQFHARDQALQTAIRESLQAPVETATHPARQYGRQTALLWVGLVLHTMQQAIANADEQLCFFTREGEFYLSIYRQLSEHQVLGTPVPPAQLLEVSRIATFAASLGQANADTLMRLWSQYSSQSPAALLRSLGLEPGDFTEYLQGHQLNAEQTIQYPWQNEHMLAFLADPEVQSHLQRRLDESRSNLIRYLHEHHIPSQGSANIGIVDIGWRGTIQDNLAHTLPHIQWHGSYLALNHYLNPQPANVSKSAWGPDRNRNEAYAHLLDAVTPLEMLSNSPHGSVTGYREENGAMRAERLIDTEENRIYEETIRHYQQGVIDTLPYWADYLRTHAYTAEEIRPVGMQLWEAIIQQPPAFLAEAYFRLKHNETFGVGGFIHKQQSLSTINILRAIYSRPHRTRLKTFLNETGWLPGLFAHPDTTPGMKYALRIVLHGAKILRRLKRTLARSA